MMAATYDGAIQELIDAFAQLPGIGPKGAQRIAFYILGADRRSAQDLADAIVAAKERSGFARSAAMSARPVPVPSARIRVVTAASSA